MDVDRYLLHHPPPVFRQRPAGPGQGHARDGGVDVDLKGLVWTVLSSGHMASFDRSKCKVLNGPTTAQLLKAKPGAMGYASAGKGTAPHIAGEMFKLATGVDMLHVPYKGSSPGTPAQLKTLVQKEVLRWKGIISAAKITAD